MIFASLFNMSIWNISIIVLFLIIIKVTMKKDLFLSLDYNFEIKSYIDVYRKNINYTKIVHDR